MQEDGTIENEIIVPDIFQVFHVSIRGEETILVSHLSDITGGELWQALVLHRFHSDGSPIASDTVFRETLDSSGGVVGSAFDERDGELLAVLVTATWEGSLGHFSARCITVTPQETRAGEAWELGAYPADSYIFVPAVTLVTGRGSVLGYYVQGPELREISFEGIDPQGDPTRRTCTLSFDTGCTVTGLAVTLVVESIYGEYTVTTSSEADRGAWVLAFPADELLEAPERAIPAPRQVSLRAYPNPFNTVTRLDFDVPAPAETSLAIYDVLGRRVTELILGRQPAGQHERLWSASTLPSGVYFARLQTSKSAVTTKLLLLR